MLCVCVRVCECVRVCKCVSVPRKKKTKVLLTSLLAQVPASLRPEDNPSDREVLEVELISTLVAVVFVSLCLFVSVFVPSRFQSLPPFLPNSPFSCLHRYLGLDLLPSLWAFSLS